MQNLFFEVAKKDQVVQAIMSKWEWILSIAIASCVPCRLPSTAPLRTSLLRHALSGRATVRAGWWDPRRSCAEVSDGRSGLLPRPIARQNGSTLRSSQFRQSGLISSHLVVDWRSRVETRQRVPTPAGCCANADR